MVVGRLLQLAALRLRSEEFKDLEIGVLGHEPAVLRRQLFITVFDSQQAIAAAEEHFEHMGEQIPEEIRGRRVPVRVYEVAYGN